MAFLLPGDCGNGARGDVQHFGGLSSINFKMQICILIFSITTMLHGFKPSSNHRALAFVRIVRKMLSFVLITCVSVVILLELYK